MGSRSHFRGSDVELVVWGLGGSLHKDHTGYLIEDLPLRLRRRAWDVKLMSLWRRIASEL